MIVKTNRSLIGYILLSIVTFGIYPLFFWHGYIRDVNTICAGDGKRTRGLFMVILLSVFTLGIYGLFWTYGMQCRLRDNAPRYRAGVIHGGGAVILWNLFGALIFGFGALIATYIQIDSLNRLAYNYTASHNPCQF